MFRILCIFPLFARHILVSLESSQQSSVTSNTFIEKVLRVVINFMQSFRVRFSPAVSAGKIAGVNVWRHLHAARRLDSVECPFVAVAIILEVLFSPVTYFDTTVFSNELVGLFSKSDSNFRFDFTLAGIQCKWASLCSHCAHLRQHIPQRGSVSSANGE